MWMSSGLASNAVSYSTEGDRRVDQCTLGEQRPHLKRLPGTLTHKLMRYVAWGMWDEVCDTRYVA